MAQIYVRLIIGLVIKAPRKKLGDGEFKSSLRHESRLCDFGPVTLFQPNPPHTTVVGGETEGGRSIRYDHEKHKEGNRCKIKIYLQISPPSKKNNPPNLNIPVLKSDIEIIQ